MGNWVEIPTDDAGIFYRQMDGGTGDKIYLRANLTESFACLITAGSSLQEIFLRIGTTNPGWQWKSENGSWADSYPIIDATYYGISCKEYDYTEAPGSVPGTLFSTYNSKEEAIEDFFNTRRYPINYRPTNCSFPNAPTEAVVGSTVTVSVTFPDGYGLVNESNIYVTNNGVVIPSSYSNGQLTFTMPDPS